MNPDAALEIPPDVLAREVGDETVLLDLASGTYFGLNAVGTRLWQLLSEGRTPRQIVEMLVAEYEAPPDQIREDALGLLHELVQRGLVRTS